MEREQNTGGPIKALLADRQTRRRRGGRDDRTRLDLAFLLADESLRSPYKHINKRGPAPGMGGKVGRGADPGNCGKGIFTANTRKCSTHFYAFFVVFSNLRS